MLDLEYNEIDGLLYPNIETGMEEIENDLSKFGIFRLRYLHEHKSEMYRELLFSGKLAQHCSEIENTAFAMAERIRVQYLARNPSPTEGMERIQAFTQAQMLTDELVLHDIIYT